MLAAISAADSGHSVTLIEANEKLGKKVYITGKGRCNVTNNCDAEDFFANVVKNSKFLYSAFYSFDNTRIQELIEDGGCPLKVERGGRVFPVSDHSSDVLKALSNQIKMRKVEVVLGCKVKELSTEQSEDDNGHNIKITGVTTDMRGYMPADKVILATGGMSYASTGSTGEMFKKLKALGHTIAQCKPSLVPLDVSEHWCGQCSGLSLKNVSVRLEAIDNENNKSVKKNKPIYEGFGEMLFTHWGVSGPLILSASSYYVEKNYLKPANLYIDLKPALSFEQLDKRLIRDFEGSNNKTLKNAIAGLLPSKLIGIVIDESGLDPSKKVAEITRAEREALVHTLKNLHLTVTGTRGFNEAIITRGGVDVREINPSTMESRIVSDLYFAGEMIDTDALTGGFNLQIAWSTGYLAGME